MLREWFREEHSGGRAEAAVITCDLEPPACSQALNRLSSLSDRMLRAREIKEKIFK